MARRAISTTATSRTGRSASSASVASSSRRRVWSARGPSGRPFWSTGRLRRSPLFAMAVSIATVPELPDIAVYLEALRPRILDRPLLQVRVAAPSWLRTVDPPLSEVRGRPVRGLRRLGKRIAIELEGELHVVLHLMIAGRLHWKPPAAKLPGRRGLGALDFPNGA